MTALEQRLRQLAADAVGSDQFTPAVLDALREAARIGAAEAFKEAAQLADSEWNWRGHDLADAIRKAAAERGP